jgi:acyl-CoA dehydrogenase
MTDNQTMPPASDQDDGMIAQSAERLYAGLADRALLERFEAGEFPADAWRRVVDSGFPIALVGEAAGGIGETWRGAWPILRGLGYWRVPLPLAETMVAGLLSSLAGIEVPDGPVTLIEDDLGGRLTVAGTGSAVRVSGRITGVPWARHCRHALASIPGTGLVLLDLADRTATRTPLDDVAKTPSDTVVLDAAPAIAVAANPLPAMARPVLVLGALARSAMMVGALEWTLEQGVGYARDRIQFGRPIGRNQALQQQLAVVAGDVAAARMASLVAAADAPVRRDDECPAAVFGTAVAKIRCGEAATRATAIVHQVHGAIGFTYEHALQYATRRLWAWREQFGSDSWWAERLGRAAIDARAQGFWPALTARRFGDGLDRA